MALLTNIGRLLTCRAEGGQAAVHAIDGAELAFRRGRISWVGRAGRAPASERGGPRWDAGGRLVVPGLVDCHTHLAFGGWRADEWAKRLGGATYGEIAKAGGGIAATVRRTRALQPEALQRRCAGFLREMAALGVTTVEAKSGYALGPGEQRLLEIYDRLSRERDLPRVVGTFLGAHVVPSAYRARRTAYVALVAQQIKRFAGGISALRFVDVFVERGAFTVDEARTLFAEARRAGLGCKLHADQLTAGGGAELAAEVGAVSADHLEHISDAGVAALARAGTVAVSLPLAQLYLGAAPLPARRLIAAGVPLAIATDFNPGTAPSFHMPLALTLACATQRLTPAEALKGATVFGARACGVEPETGTLEPGKAADFAIIDAPDEAHWLYHFRANACLLTVRQGRPLWRAPGWTGAPAPRRTS
jgi:imidazolonepropionase